MTETDGQRPEAGNTVGTDQAEQPSVPDPMVGPSVPPKATDRARSPYSTKQKIGRILWDYFGQPIFSLTFHNWYKLRSSILRRFGAKIAPGVRLRPSVKVQIPWNLTIGTNTGVGDHTVLYCLAPITIGENCTISQYAHLCAGTHDHTRSDMPLVTKPVVIEPETWIAADTFIGPGVTVGRGSVVGARSSVFKDLEPWGIYAGNPARKLRDRALDETAADQSE